MSSTHSSPPRVRLARRSAIIGAAVAAALVGWAVPAAAQPTAAFPAQVTPTPVAFDLYAVTGTTTLPGLPSVTVWGYSRDGTGVTKPGGPDARRPRGRHGDDHAAQHTRRDELARRAGPGMRTDRVGAPPPAPGRGPTRSPPNEAGTYLYEAGLLANSPHQVAMGLYGALVVRRARGLPMDPTLKRRCWSARSTRRSTVRRNRPPSTCASSRRSTPSSTARRIPHGAARYARTW